MPPSGGPVAVALIYFGPLLPLCGRAWRFLGLLVGAHSLLLAPPAGPALAPGPGLQLGLRQHVHQDLVGAHGLHQEGREEGTAQGEIFLPLERAVWKGIWGDKAREGGDFFRMSLVQSWQYRCFIIAKSSWPGAVQRGRTITFF